jgi:hypothetical protein
MLEKPICDTRFDSVVETDSAYGIKLNAVKCKSGDQDGWNRRMSGGTYGDVGAIWHFHNGLCMLICIVAMVCWAQSRKLAAA